MRFFVSKDNITNDEILIEHDDFLHITKVLRMKTGENITVCDGDCNDYKTEIFEISKKSIKLKILEKLKNSNEQDFKITLFQGLPKSDKMDLIIQKCTELGVKEIVPIITERVVVVKKDFLKKTGRYRKIAESAAKQSERGIVPVVSEPIAFKEAIKQDFDLKIIPYELEKEMSLKNLLKNIKNIKSFDNIAVYIGPEGGFTEKEIEIAKENSVRSVSLGKRVLRTETSGFFTIAVLSYEREGN